jgi:Cu/Ag efflux pump CusA
MIGKIIELSVKNKFLVILATLFRHRRRHLRHRANPA